MVWVFDFTDCHTSSPFLLIAVVGMIVIGPVNVLGLSGAISGPDEIGGEGKTLE